MDKNDVTLVLMASLGVIFLAVFAMEAVSDTLQSRNYKWNMIGYVGPGETEWERNHNPGLVKTENAYIPNSEKVQVVVSTGHNS